MKKNILLLFNSFVKNLNKNDRIALLFHRDPDGLCSALIVSFALKKLKKIKVSIALPLEYNELDFNLIKLLKRKGIEKIIIVDLGLDNMPHIVKALEEFASILLIDHHKIYADLNSEKTIFVKAQFLSSIDGSKYPATKLCFDLFSKHVNLNDLSWIAAIGVNGDFGFNSWRSFIEDSFKKFNYSKEELDIMTEIINSLETIKPKKFIELFKAFFSFKTPKQFINSKFFKFREKLLSETNSLIKEFNEKAEFLENELIFFEFKSKYNIKSFLANKLSLMHPNKTLVLIEDLGKEKLMLSARRQDFKVKMNELLEFAVKGIKNASAGGHIPAAAGSIPRKNLKEFKKRVIENQRKQLDLTKTFK